jgi:hypothetical protein
VWLYTSIISILGRLREEDHEFQVSLGCIDSISKRKKKKVCAVEQNRS